MISLDDIEILTSTDESAQESWKMLATDGIDIPVQEVKDVTVQQDGYCTDLRIYYPEGEGPFPVMFFIHGGAFVGGFNLMDEPLCRKVCHDVGCAVISPNYRLAPEYRWPAAIEELYQLLVHLKQNAQQYNLDMERLAIGGSSAGANYSAAICAMAHEKEWPVFRHQTLVYPVTDLQPDASHKANAFTMGDMGNPDVAYQSLIDPYLPKGADTKNPLISPLYAPVEAFPKTAIFSGRGDLLWWDGKALADKLIEGGVETLYKCYSNVGHGFLELAGNEHVSRDVKELICVELKRNL